MSAVHTSAPAVEPDMFGGTRSDWSGDLESVVREIVGVLVQPAEVRTRIVGSDHHAVPVLCLELRALAGTRRSMHVEQVYTPATRHAAELKARSLKCGQHVTFRIDSADLVDMRVTFPHVRSIAATPVL